MTTVMMECVKFNSFIAQYRQRSAASPVTTNLELIGNHVKNFSEYTYEQAIQNIQRDNPLTASRATQTKFNKTIF
jgi:hypothetical protein